MDVYKGIIHNHQFKCLSAGDRISKLWYIHPYSGILLRKKKGMDFWYIQQHGWNSNMYAKCKKTDSKGCICIWVHLSDTLKRVNLNWWENKARLEIGGGIDSKGMGGDLGGWCSLSWLQLVTWLCVCPNWKNFALKMVCSLYVNCTFVWKKIF